MTPDERAFILVLMWVLGYEDRDLEIVTGMGLLGPLPTDYGGRSGVLQRAVVNAFRQDRVRRDLSTPMRYSAPEFIPWVNIVTAAVLRYSAIDVHNENLRFNYVLLWLRGHAVSENWMATSMRTPPGDPNERQALLQERVLEAIRERTYPVDMQQRLESHGCGAMQHQLYIALATIGLGTRGGAAALEQSGAEAYQPDYGVEL